MGKDDLIAALMEAFPDVPPQGEGEICASEAAEAWGITWSSAKTRLDHLVLSGTWTCRRCLNNIGKQSLVYRPIDKDAR